eukprot:scaffold30606_cov39-Prasinocladus_malaysianus.AAC.1
MRWWKAWEEFSGLSAHQGSDSELEDSPAASHPGPICNSDLVEDSEAVQANGEPQLQEGLKEGIDFKLISAESWDRLQAAYGGGPAIKRRLVRSASSSQPSAEVYGISVSVVTDSTSFNPQRTDLTLSVETTVAELKRSSSGHAEAGSDSSSSDTNILSPSSDMATSLAPMSITNTPNNQLTSSNLNRMGAQNTASSFFSDSSTPSQGAERGLAGSSTV